MAASQRYAGVGRSLGVRAVHLHLLPRPRSIAERRTILNLIEEYGPVEMFKSFKYVELSTSNTMVAIFRTEEAALKLIRASPIRFTFLSNSDVKHTSGETREAKDAASTTGPRNDLGAPASTAMSSDRAALAENAKAARTASAAPSSETAPSSREYQLTVNVATMHHRDQINVSHYNGPFALTKKSAIQEDLALRVPVPGLSDSNLQANEKHWRNALGEIEQGRRRHRTLRQMLDDN